MESLSHKLTERRKKNRYSRYGKRMSILTPGNANLSHSFYGKENEDTLATDSLQNFGVDHPHSFNVDQNDEGDFKEIFKVLDELEDDSNIFGNINSKSEVEPSPEDEKREQYEQKKEDFLGKSFDLTHNLFFNRAI